jgi:hypothetical protein
MLLVLLVMLVMLVMLVLLKSDSYVLFIGPKVEILYHFRY